MIKQRYFLLTVDGNVALPSYQIFNLGLLDVGKSLIEDLKCKQKMLKCPGTGGGKPGIFWFLFILSRK